LKLWRTKNLFKQIQKPSIKGSLEIKLVLNLASNTSPHIEQRQIKLKKEREAKLKKMKLQQKKKRKERLNNEPKPNVFANSWRFSSSWFLRSFFVVSFQNISWRIQIWLFPSTLSFSPYTEHNIKVHNSFFWKIFLVLKFEFQPTTIPIWNGQPHTTGEFFDG